MKLIPIDPSGQMDVNRLVLNKRELLHLRRTQEIVEHITMHVDDLEVGNLVSIVLHSISILLNEFSLEDDDSLTDDEYAICESDVIRAAKVIASAGFVFSREDALEYNADSGKTPGIFTDEATNQTVHVPEDNNILYGQDFRFYRGVPPGEYELRDNGGYWKLVAPGYGMTGKGYGNGALAIPKSQPVPWSQSSRDNG